MSYSVYLMGYFRSGPAQTHKDEKLHYAYSRDGLHWYELNQNQPVWESALGEGILRDPFIAKGPDGFWHMVFTIRPKDINIGYARSKDLIHWTDEKALNVMEGVDNTQNCWAPEFTYDTEKGEYLIYWASSVGKDLSNSKHFSTRTSDWTGFTEPKLFFDPGFQTIDASLAFHNGKYYMTVKDESHVYEPQKHPNPPMNILAVSDQIDGPYEIIPGIQTPDYTEAPEFLRIEDQNKWLLIYDYWAHGKFAVMQSEDMREWSSELDERSFRFPFRARHATVFQISEQELTKLLETYSMQAHYHTPTYSPVRFATEEAGGYMHDAFSLRSITMNIHSNTIDGKQLLYDEGDTVNGIALRIRDGRLEAAVSTDGEKTIIGTEFDPEYTGQWIHVAVTFSEGKIQLYMNGKLVNSGDAAYILVGTHTGSGGYGGRFGSDAFGDSKGKDVFDGIIRNVRIYSVPLQEEDICLMAQKETSAIVRKELPAL